MQKYEGYGVDISKMTLKEAAYQNLYQMIQKSNSALREEITAYYEENKHDTPYLSEETAFYDFCEDWYENEANLGSGIEQVITDFINEQEFGNTPRFACEDYIIHVPANIPVDETDKAQFPTQNQIAEILRKYLSPLYKTTGNITWYIIHLD